MKSNDNLNTDNFFISVFMSWIFSTHLAELGVQLPGCCPTHHPRRKETEGREPGKPWRIVEAPTASLVDSRQRNRNQFPAHPLSQYIPLHILVFIPRLELLVLPCPGRVPAVGTVQSLPAPGAKRVVGEGEGTARVSRASVPWQGELAPEGLISSAWRKASFGSGIKCCRCW